MVIDCAHGATYHIAPNVLSELGAEVICYRRCDPNGININEKCGTTDVRQLQERVLAEGADVGLAFDGDGDRLIMVDHLGLKKWTVTGSCLSHCPRSTARGTTARWCCRTLMSNMGLELALETTIIPFERAKVGDRYCRKTSGKKAGARVWVRENSGHIILLDKTTTGDGIVVGLQVTECHGTQQHEPARTCSGVKTAAAKVLVNVRFCRSARPAVNEEVTRVAQELKKSLNGKGAVCCCVNPVPKPLIRVMVEGEDEAQVTRQWQTD